MKRYLGSLSRFINYWTGGEENESLCGRWCRVHGSDAWICRVIDWLLGDHHCLDERIAHLKRLRKK